MRSRPCRFSVLLFLLPLQILLGQTVVNSTYVGPGFGGSYGTAKNWAPAEVPNNTNAKHYTVTIPPTIVVDVDVDATISNLTLGSFVRIFGKTLTVTGTTLSPVNEVPNIQVGAPATMSATFNAGTLAAFSGNTLRGRYIIGAGASPATVQFNGADVVTLSGELNLFGGLARVVDENGNDALRNLARIETDAIVTLEGRNLTASAPFTNNGTLNLGGNYATIFTAVSSLTNFDSGTRTLTGGTFVLQQFGQPGNLPIELRFNGADIVNNGSAIELQGLASRIVDLGGNDGLRNLAKNLPGASLTLTDHDFATAGSFDNEGFLSLTRSTFVVTGPFANFDPATRTLSGGAYDIFDGVLKFNGADIVRNGASISLFDGKITDLAGNDALRNFNENLSAGTFVVGLNQKFTAPGNFTNAGRVETHQSFVHIPEASDTPGTFVVPAGFSYTQTGGTTVNDGVMEADNIRILGGMLSTVGSIKGNLFVSNAVVEPGGEVGSLTLSSGAHLQVAIGSYNTFETWGSIPGQVALGGSLDVTITDQTFLANNAVLTLLHSDGPITGSFDNAPNRARFQTADGKGSFVILYEANAIKLTQFQANPPPAQFLNISTRAFLFPDTAKSPHVDPTVLIGGFIVTGTVPKKVALRGIGPSLSKAGVSPVLADPVLELHGSSGAVLLTNDDWRDSQAAEIMQNQIAPQDDRESVIITTLVPEAYTVVLREKNGLSGTGLVEVYDLSGSDASKLGNISTLGFTDANNILIGGIIVGSGQANAEIVARAIGPQLRRSGIFNALEDPTLELRNNNGAVVGFNDDWVSNFDQIPDELRPFQNSESAMRVSLIPGNYTALVRSKGNGGGVALVEFYDLRR